MDRNTAIAKLRQQIDHIGGIKKLPRFSSAFTKWQRDTEVIIEHIFGRDERHPRDFKQIRYRSSVGSFRDHQEEERFRKGLDEASAILQSMVTEIEELCEEQPAPPREATALLRTLCERFPLFARRLRQPRREGRPTFDISDEYDVQHLLGSLLAIHFDDIRREEWTPSYAGGSARMDFLLKKENIVIEVKRTRQSLRQREVGDELLIDIQRYQAHSDCKTLVCFIYDPDGYITNPCGLEADLSQPRDGLEVMAIVSPKGS